MKLKERILLVIPLLVIALYLLFVDNSDTSKSDSLSLQREVYEVGIYDSMFMVGLDSLQDFTMVSTDFMKFYERFNSDSLFQKKHILFPLKGVCFANCDTSLLWNEKDWHQLRWDFRAIMEDQRYENVLAQSDKKLFFKCVFKDLGILYEVGFIKKYGSWKMVYCVLNGC